MFFLVLNPFSPKTQEYTLLHIAFKRLYAIIVEVLYKLKTL